MSKKKKQRDPARIESMVRRIMEYYVDSTEDDDTDFLILYLGGGMIPAESAEIMRPILESLVDADSEFGSTLAQADFDSLEHLHRQIELLNEQKAATRSDLKSAIHDLKWSDSERAIASQFGLRLLPAGDRVLDVLSQAVALSDFTAEEVVSAFQTETERVIEFCGRWYADCNSHDYGEEWDPAEGNQQEGNPPGEVLGITQGFMVSHIVLFLYAAHASDRLVHYFKRRKMPHGKKVAKDVLRVYRQATKTSS